MKSIRKFVEKDPKTAYSIAVEILQQIKIENDQDFSNFLERTSNKTEFSIILPIYNEEENIKELYTRLTHVLQNEKTSYEIIFVNDGSQDKSKLLISKLHAQDNNVKLIDFSRNFGHQAAFSAGIDYCRGNAIILMDSDLQDPPEVLPEMIKKWRDGYEVVYAVRKKRKESVFKKTAYFLFYRFLQIIANINIPLDSGDFCLMDRKVVEELKALPEKNVFLRGLRSWVGFKQIDFSYERDARFAGEAKYNFRKLVGLALNGIVSFSSFPLRLATYLGLITFFLGILILIFVLTIYFVNNQAPQGWTSLIVIVLLIGGVQLVLLGAIGEYIARIYDETKNRPNYIVKDFMD